MNRLEIEWRHLDKDGKTCDRCADTGTTVQRAYETLSKELRSKGWKVVLKETLLTAERICDSNTILLNGVPIEKLLPNARKSENCCASCGDLLGAPTICRTLMQNGRTYEAIPAALIIQAAYLLIDGKTS
ncbi:MAG: DUF2703 domain-containing protein [Desulfobacteraceae bacterium]|jgi:hypothetical protein